MKSRGPFIALEPGADRIRIRQQRPSLAPVLSGMTVREALEAVPRLLPICGVAQSVAAERAVEAATGRRESAADFAAREARLVREQARAAAWRLTVDWPDLLSVPRAMEPLRAIRQTGDHAALARLLRRLLDGLERVDSLERAMTWAAASGSMGARVLRRTLAGGDRLERRSRLLLLKGEALAVAAIGALAVVPFDPRDPHAEAPVEVGPLAMARHPLIPELRESLGAVPTVRLLALLLDTVTIADRLAGGGRQAGSGSAAWPLDPGCGLGRATTARGPVFHRVTLEPGNPRRVADWRVLAPTDWHFAPEGPVANVIPGVDRDQAALALLVASYDPCAPWSIDRAAGS